MQEINYKTTFALVLIGLVFVVVLATQVSAFSVRELLGLDKPEPEATEQENQVSKTGARADNPDREWAKTAKVQTALSSKMDLDYFTLLVTNMNAAERSKVLTEPGIFKQLVENEANNQATISAALQNNVEKDKNVEFLMQRSAENILREAYITRLIAARLPADFPTSEQVAEYYENNKAKFVTPERVHVWQIFFAKPTTADKKKIAALKQKAGTISADLKKGKHDFSSIALSQSEHDQSKAVGGYMGLINTADLLPEIKQTILKLKQGEISAPVESDAGIHILKRDKIVQAEQIALPQVESQIKNLLRNEANKQLRTAIFSLAREEFPQDITDEKIEAWRVQLRTETNQ